MSTEQLLTVAGLVLGVLTASLAAWAIVLLRSANWASRQMSRKLNEIGGHVERLLADRSGAAQPVGSASDERDRLERFSPPQPVARHEATADPRRASVTPSEPDPVITGEYAVPRASAPRATPRRPVELEGSALVPSRSLAAVGSLQAPEYGGEGRLFVNPEVQIDEFSLVAWARWFDFGSAPANRFYRTSSPALVRWNASSSTGELLQRGVAEAVS